MLRAVIDPGVLISGLISPSGAPAELLRRWIAGEFQIVWSPALLEEFTAVGSRERFRQWFTASEALRIATVLRDAGEGHDDVGSATPPPSDPADGYLVDLVETAGCDLLVTGDTALLAHRSGTIPIVTPRRLIEVLDALDAG